ncbi:hypothetical protein N0V82_005737 [Gnomoniopsis sp. IMI 355080]|nr:hypothetical protein N0V82_005737 [Gnomoniopsis sp. IMI 355080]
MCIDRFDYSDYSFDCIGLSRNHLEFYSITIDKEAEPMVYVRDRQSANGTFVNGSLIGRSSGVTPGRLLDDGDIITSKAKWHFRVKLLAMKRMPLSTIQRAEAKFFSSQYIISDMVLGSGTSTTVRLAHDVTTGQQLACKVYDLRVRMSYMFSGEVMAIMRAVDLTTSLDHPNISSLKCAYKSRHTLFVFEELAAGGDLYSLVCGRPRLTELEVKWMLRQMLSGLQYLHAKGIAHRDIKLENVLLCVCQNPAHRIALTDFGHAEVMPKGGSLKSGAGTPGWQAPELFHEGRAHGLAVDMWSMGMVAVQLLIGRCQSRTMNKIEDTLPAEPDIKTLDFKSVFDEIYEIRHELISDGSPREDFIHRCLECDPDKRLTVNEALEHPYINEPAGVRQRFERSAQQTTAGWTSRIARAEIQVLPDVLRPPPSFANGIKEQIEPKMFIHEKKGALEEDIEYLKSPHFKFTKALDTKSAQFDKDEERVESCTKRARSDEAEEKEESCSKRARSDEAEEKEESCTKQ